jgi:hypothetical protein
VIERAEGYLPNVHTRAAERARRSISEHRLVGHLAAPSDRVTMREALPMSFEHTGEEVRGVEPTEEQLV